VVREFDRAIVVSELYFQAEPFLSRGARSFGWLAMPQDPAEKLPAMLLIHGGGGTAIEVWARQWAARGFAALAIDLYGNGPGRQRLPDGGCDWSDMNVAFEFTQGVENSWIYQSVANCIRAVSVLSSLPEINADQVGVSGVSWGGYLTSTIMCVDDRVGLGIPVCGCGFDHRAGNAIDATAEKRERVYQLFDASNSITRCMKPVLFVGGIWDPPPDQLMSCYHAIPDARKTLSIRLHRHHNDAGYMGTAFDHLEPMIFADTVFRHGPAMPRLGTLHRNGCHVTIDYQSDVGLFSSSVHWTDADGRPWQQRKWNSAWANIADGVITAEIDTDAPTVVYATAVDLRGALSSSPFDLGK
jgi:cephalosporin-C deacetylase-like acetyl esterase